MMTLHEDSKLFHEIEDPAFGICSADTIGRRSIRGV